jgi:hypothetical protein
VLRNRPEDSDALCRDGQGVLTKSGFWVAHLTPSRSRIGLCQKE